MAISYENQQILITGGSSGIGLALAEAFARRGANLWLMARRLSGLEAARQRIIRLGLKPGQRVEIFSGDVSHPQDVTALAAKIRTDGITPNCIINSAGIVYCGYAQDISIETFHSLMQVNYHGTVQVCKTFLPEMLERGSGHIVNLSSMAGYVGVFGYTAYSASKFAVTGFSEALRAELKPHGVRVSVVFPPDTDTPQLAYESTLKPPETRALGENGGLMSAAAVAQSILQGVERGQFRIFPNAQAAFFYRISSVLNEALNAYGDWVVKTTQSKKTDG